MGALVGLIFPPALIGTAVRRRGGGRPRRPPREEPVALGAWRSSASLLEAGEAGLVVIGDWRLEERTDELMQRAERLQAKELRDLDRADTEEQIADLMSGQGS